MADRRDDGGIALQMVRAVASDSAGSDVAARMSSVADGFATGSVVSARPAAVDYHWVFKSVLLMNGRM